MDLPTRFETLMNHSPLHQGDVNSFLREMRRTPSGTLTTTKLLAGKIQSASEAQAIHAFDFIEACLSSETEGSIEFRTEVGRYRFLNEIIRILSPKYMGESTLLPVKERAIKFVEDAAGPKRKKWFPSEYSKINAVYQSLVDGGVIKKSTMPSSEAEEAELQKSIFDRAENAQVLKKLLQSKNPSDLQAANRLIKTLVAEESKRVERRAELHSLIDRIETSTSLMTEMLSQTKIDIEIVEELAETCKNLQQRLGGVATETNDETTSLLQASENLEVALKLFDSRTKVASIPTSPVPTEPQTDGNEDQVSFVDKLLLDMDLESSEHVVDSMKCNSDSTDLMNLQDVTLDKASFPSTIPVNLDKPTTLDEIEKLSRELMLSSLQNNSSNNALDTKKPDKTPLNQIGKPPSTNQEHVSPSLLDLDFFDQDKIIVAHTAGNNEPPENTIFNLENSLNHNNSKNLQQDNFTEFKKMDNDNHDKISDKDIRNLLANVKDLDLDNVDPISNLEPLLLNLESNCPNVELRLTFGNCSELPKVIIGILTLANKSCDDGINNYVFQLLPPKGVMVKLLPPTSMELPAWKKRFLPPPMITQVALWGYPSKSVAMEKKKFKFILSYSTDDDTALHNGNFDIPPEVWKKINS